MKPGLRTSEFWLTIGAMIVTLLNMKTGDNLVFDDLYTAILGGVVAVYTIGRSIIKAFGGGNGGTR